MNITHDAFISYSRGADSALAKALEEGLEKLAKPLLALRAIDVFRDETSLAANPDLWVGIVDHLSASRWLVVLACPEWASSSWCNREVIWWLENRSADRMLVVITGGELAWDTRTNDLDWTITTALNSGLQGRFQQEPLYVDLRWARSVDGLSVRHPRFRDAVLNLAAPIRGVRKDELDGADVRQLRRNRRLVRSGVAAISVAAVVATWQAIVATQQRNEAARQTRIALSRGLGALARQQLAGDDPAHDVALLAATQAVKLDPGPIAKGALLAALQEHPALHRVLRPGARAYTVEFSPDGSTLASAGEDGAISIWEVATGRLRRRIADAHRDKIWALAFLPDGKKVVTASLDTTAATWDVESGQIVGRRMRGHADEILSLAVSGDGRLTATACLDGSVWLWSLERQQPILKLERAHDRGARAVAFSRDGTVLVSGGFDGRIKAWHVPDGKPLPAPGKSHEDGVLRLVFSADGLMLASSGQDGAVQRWDTRTWKPVFPRPFTDHRAGVPGLAFSPDGRALASGGEDNRIIVWYPGQSEDETETGIYRYHNNQVWQVAFSPDGNFLAAASWDATISIWEARGTTGFLQTLTQYPRGIHGLAMDPTGRLLALGDPSGRIHLHAINEGRTRAVLHEQDDEVLTLAFSGNGQLLASSALDGTIAVWDINKDRRLLWKTTVPRLAVFDMAFSPDEKMLVAAGGDGSLTRWNASSGQAITPVLHPHRDGAGSAVVAFHPTKPYFASGGRGGGVFLWDAATGQRLQTLLAANTPSSGVDAMAFSPDGRTFVAVPSGSVLYLWNDGNWGTYTTLEVGTESIEKVAFSADSRALVLGGHGTVSLWDLESKQPVMPEPLRGSVRQVWGLAVSKDGRWLAAAYPASEASLWNLDSQVWLDQACRVANRTLDPTEWRELVGPFPYEQVCPVTR